MQPLNNSQVFVNTTNTTDVHIHFSDISGVSVNRDSLPAFHCSGAEHEHTRSFLSLKEHFQQIQREGVAGVHAASQAL